MVQVEPANTTIGQLLARIDADLPALARELIPRSETASPSFLANPDDPAEHKPEWHQFGIITHTRELVAALDTEVPAALREIDPAIAARVDSYLAESIDGLTRRELGQIAGYWHDIGKFSSRTLGRRGDWRFRGHAHESARLLTGERDDYADGIGVRYALTRAQIAYVARLADLHYAPMELNLALKRAEGPHDDAAVYATIAARLGAEGYAVCCIFWADCLAKGAAPRQLAERPALWGVLVNTLRAVDRLRIADCGL
ncbi:MAG: hypothetical protein U0841_23780 [Chloroflexia bacterium]